MTRAAIAGGAAATVLALVALIAGHRALEKGAAPAETISTTKTTTKTTALAMPPQTAATAENHAGFLYGRITTHDGSTYEGRLRFGDGEEAFWGHYFNGSKGENPWTADVPNERRPKERRSVGLFSVEIAVPKRPVDLRRPFMARFGDIARIEARGADVRVTLKSGTVFDLNRLSASDFDDGVRVWNARHGVVDLDSLRIRKIELLPAARSEAAPDPLHGTVRTRQGDDFTGFLQWDREACVGSDELDGLSAEGELRLRFDSLRSIARHSRNSSLVTLIDGHEIVLSGTREVGRGNRGIYVDDPRYGRVLISWKAFERLDFSPGGSGPAYDDFPPSHPLTGSITTRAGRRLAGRLIYDLDESETTETLDAPFHGVDYTIPFGLIASIVPRGGEGPGGHARVTLHRGEELQLERTGDLGNGNAGLLIFTDDRERPEYMPWADVGQIDLDRPPAMFPPIGHRWQGSNLDRSHIATAPEPPR